MDLFHIFQTKKYLMRIFLWITAVTLLIVSSFSALIYLNVESRVFKSEYENSQKLLLQMKYNIDYLDTMIRNLTHVIEIARSFKQIHHPHNQIITEAEAYISKHYADNLTLQLVADHVHITPVWLSKLFKKEKQTPFLEYLTAVRIDKAKVLLNDLQFRIYQVAQEVGYKDSVHFTKIFKKVVGYTPKEYRNMRGIQDE